MHLSKGKALDFQNCRHFYQLYSSFYREKYQSGNTKGLVDCMHIYMGIGTMFLSSWKEGITTKWVFLYVKISGKIL